jgi:uncharacterized protein (DUF2336 family)
MIEANATGLTAVAQEAAFVTAPRPRVSAASFKDLTARLRKVDVPAMTPMAAPVAPPSPVISAATVSSPAPAPVAAPEFEPIEPTPAAESPEPPVVAAPVSERPAPRDLVDILAGSETPLGATLEEAPAPTTWLNEPVVVTKPLAPAPAISIEPIVVAPTPVINPVLEPKIAVQPAVAPVVQEPLVITPVVVKSDPLPVSPVAKSAPAPLHIPDIFVAPVEAPAPEITAAPISPAPAPEPAQPEPVAEVVTEPEEPELAAKDDVANEPLKEQLKSRQIKAELDLIWRMLLATPTAEERNAYLREAELLTGHKPEPLPEPAPEFDLSAIAPAADVQPTLTAEALELPVEATETGEPAIILEDDPAAVESSELARSLLDMMASGNASGLPQERALAADTLLKLSPRLDVKSLAMMSQRVARMDNPPALLVARLLRDPRVEVSGPLLEDCPQITDKDLELVVAENDSARLRMIARRRSLSPAITDALVKSDDPSVHLTLARNMEANISQDGFLHLIAAAGSNIDLLAPLCTRADMTAPMAFELFWHAPAQLRRFILSRFLTDSETLTKILRITMSTNDLDVVQEQEGSLQHAVVEALERAARGKVDIAAEELGKALKISAKTAKRALTDKEGEPLVVLLKTAGYPRQALAGLLNRFRDPEIGLLDENRDPDELVSIFETLSFNKARILLTYWDWAQRRTGPYAPLE